MTSPIRDNDGTVDSDLLLKWGGAGIALILLACRGLGGFFGYSGEQLPGLDSISMALMMQFGSAAAYVSKHKIVGTNRGRQ